MHHYITITFKVNIDEFISDKQTQNLETMNTRSQLKGSGVGVEIESEARNIGDEW